VSAPSIAQVQTGDRARAISTIVSAFTDDPVERWLFPEPEQYQTHFGEFVAAFAGDPVDKQTIWALGDFHATAIWLAPGARVDEAAIAAVLTDGVAPEQHADMFSVLEQMDRAHPSFEHWYLPWLGVVLGAQGSGLGGRLLEHGLAIVDRDHLPAYLETPNPRTVPFYERHGFVVSARSQSGRARRSSPCSETSARPRRTAAPHPLLGRWARADSALETCNARYPHRRGLRGSCFVAVRATSASLPLRPTEGSKQQRRHAR